MALNNFTIGNCGIQLSTNKNEINFTADNVHVEYTVERFEHFSSHMGKRIKDKEVLTGAKDVALTFRTYDEIVLTFKDDIGTYELQTFPSQPIDNYSNLELLEEIIKRQKIELKEVR